MTPLGTARDGYPPLQASAEARGRMLAWLAAASRSDASSDDDLLALAAEALCDLPALAEGHGVSALVDGQLATGLPSQIVAAIRDAAERTRSRQQQLGLDSEAIAVAFDQASLPFVRLKSGAFEELLYSAAEARPRADIDLLIPEGQTGLALSVLRDLGYREQQRSWKHRMLLKPNNRRVVDRRGEHPENPRPVELHPRLEERFRGMSFGLQPRCLSSGEQRLTLPEALAHLCAHATVDLLQRRARLIQLIDITRLSRLLAEEDWEALLALSGSPDRTRFVFPALRLTQRTVGLAAPEGWLRDLGSRCKPALRTWAELTEIDALSWSGRAQSKRSLLETIRIWPMTRREQLRVWRSILWPGRWELADRYPGLADSWAWPLMYPRHLAYNTRCLALRLRQRR